MTSDAFFFIMIQRSIFNISLCGAILLSGLMGVSCSSDKSDLDKRLDNRNERYSTYQDRRGMRTQARQERTDRWFDRAMGLPPKNDTGLKLPD